MGYHDALYQLDIDFASEEQIVFADESMETISYYALLASSELAAERGSYSSYQGSKWQRGILPVDSLDLFGTRAQSLTHHSKRRKTRLDTRP